jgi:uncharacterized protein YgiB involved in biofilm formation
MRQLWKIAVASAVAAALSACGGDPAPKAPQAAVEHGVFISSSDCAATGKLTLDQCGQAIDEAVRQYQARTPAYESAGQCEEAAGAERCEKGFDGRYRQQLQAFFVTLAAPGHAVPLYAPSKSIVGFQSPSKQIIDARDDTLRVSEAALTLAHENARLAATPVDHSVRLGTAAADIH